MRVCEIRIDHDGLLGVASRRSPSLLVLLGAQIADDRPCFGALCVSQSIIGIELDCLIEQTDRLAKVLEITALEIKMTLEVSIVRLYALRRSPLSRSLIRS